MNNKEIKGPRNSDSRFNTPNNSILTPKMWIDGWYDHLIMDLKLKRINDSIDLNVQGPRSHKLKCFDDDYETIARDLRHREDTGNRRRIAKTHGDYVKYCVAKKRVIVQWVPSKENVADIFTKPLSRGQFRTLRAKLMNK